MKNKLVTLSMVCALIVGCSSTKTPVVNDSSTSDVKPTTDLAPSKPVEDSSVKTQEGKSNHNSVYFAFDKFTINDNFTSLIKTNSNYLAATSMAKVQVQGNTDDVGSVEYNLALGQRRAEVVEKALVANGASPSQIEAISNGKLKSKYENNSEVGRAKNRRSDILYVSGKPNGYTVAQDGTPMVDGNMFSGDVQEGVMQ